MNNIKYLLCRFVDKWTYLGLMKRPQKNLVRGSKAFYLFLLLTSFLVTGFSSPSFAQVCPAGRQCYYVPASLPRPSNPAGNNFTSGAALHDLVLSAAGGPVSGTYRINGGAAIPFVATSATPTIVALASDAPSGAGDGSASAFDVVETRGIFVEASTAELSVSSRLIVGPWQSSASIKEASFGLGTRFRVAGYNLNRNSSGSVGYTGYDSISVYSPVGATVTIEAPPGAVAPYWGDGIMGLTRQVTMAPGETYVIRTLAGDTCNVEIDGSLVTSDSPVMVMSGGRGWAGGCGTVGGCGDEGLDTITPIANWGAEFVVVDAPGAAEDVRIVADTNNTEVRLDGVLVATLAAGEVHTFSPFGTQTIQTTEPVGVWHNAARSGCETGLAFVPPADLRDIGTYGLSVNVSGTGVAVAVIDANVVGSLKLDGVAVVGTVTTPPGLPGVRVVTFNISGGNHRLEATGDYHLGLLTAVGGTGLYAYYAPFRVDGCGDGTKDAGEACDDGNVAPYDGCSSVCLIEPGGSTCTGDPDCANGAICVGGTCQLFCFSDLDCTDGNACTQDVCNNPGTAQAACSNPGETAGTMCATGVCDGVNACVECVDGTDCTSGVCDLTLNQCSAPGCTDLTMNGTETDVDCGGDCPSCDDGQMCTITDDCSSQVCTGGTCTIPTCDDNVINGDETDLDCGGSCLACVTGQACTGSSDCVSLVCGGGICQEPSCSDGVLNGTEEGLDCGAVCGTTCVTCGNGTLESGETCDDGNTNSEDGCDDSCLIETGYTCPNLGMLCEPLDSDGDGVSDLVECSDPAFLDCENSDDDDIPDYLDLDSDNDGIPDAIECTENPCEDTDDDETPDFLDLDSDNDGLTDALEAYDNDENGDGILDSFEDLDGDGADDSVITNAQIPLNTDGGGLPDFRSTDSDGDGITDLIEGSDANGDGVADATPVGEDSDLDGIDDAFDPDCAAVGDCLDDTISTIASLPDSDDDDVFDFRDTDDDGDGVDTVAEDTAGNGNGSTDTDGDGVPNYLDTDDDGDGLLTVDEDVDGDGDVNNDDTDDNGMPNYLDPDDDGDSIPTLDEDVDGNGDVTNDDTDGNGTPNYLDPDDDGDDTNTKDEDPDGDGNPANDDSDGDGTPDYLDPAGSTDNNSGDIIVAGGPGCSAVQSSPSSLWFLMIGFAAMLRRRR